MDNKEKDIQKEIENTMQSLDDIPRLKANPWLFARLEEQLKTTEKPSALGALSQLLQPAIVACLLLLNVYTAYAVFSNTSIEEDGITDSIESEYSYMADQSLEYYISE